MSDLSVLEHDAPETFRLTPAEQLMASLKEQGAHRFDPVRFRYIEAIMRRAHKIEGTVSVLLENKAERALHEYRIRFEKARAESAVSVDRLCLQYPDAAEEIQKLFKESDFKGLKKFLSELETRHHRVSLASMTLELRRHDDRCQNDIEAGHDSESGSLDALLRKQENEALLACLGDSIDSIAPRHSANELKSIQFFRDAWAQLSSGKRIAKAIENIPENAGPLNSHVLVIRSLSMMREISPEYVNRFVSYVDSLLWLEQAGKKTESAAEKMPVGKAKVKGGRSRSS